MAIETPQRQVHVREVLLFTHSIDSAIVPSKKHAERNLIPTLPVRCSLLCRECESEECDIIGRDTSEENVLGKLSSVLLKDSLGKPLSGLLPKRLGAREADRRSSELLEFAVSALEPTETIVRLNHSCTPLVPTAVGPPDRLR
jgi:hypothetical protein